MRPALDLQLKATTKLCVSKKGSFRYPLNRRNYDLPRDETQTPRLLILLALPEDEEGWMTIRPKNLC